jgi:6-phosphogluconolactonase (cycloisomerase 2 family)
MPNLVWVLLLSFCVTGCSGMQSLEATSPADPPPNTSAASCGPQKQPASFSSQILFGVDIQDDDSRLWAYKIDNQTGALQELPWSPLKTFSAPRAATPDFAGNFLYISEEADFSTGAPGAIEVLKMDPQDGVPTSMQKITQIFRRQIAFDPSGAYLYGIDPTTSTASGEHISTMHTYARGCDGTLKEVLPSADGRRTATSFGFKDSGNFVLLAGEQDEGSSPTFANNLDIFRRDANTGVLTLANAQTFTNTSERFIAVPNSGPFFIGVNCSPSPGQVLGAQVFSFDPNTATAAPVQGSILANVCLAFFDPTEQYVATIEIGDPSHSAITNVLSIYRLEKSTGKLIQTDRHMFPGSVIGITFDLNSRFLYASVNTIPTAIYGFSFDQSTGTLNLLPSSPFPAPQPIAFRPMFVVGRP